MVRHSSDLYNMNYELIKHNKYLQNEQVVNETITLRATFPSGLFEDRIFPLEQGETAKDASIKHSAELEQTLKETQIENVPILTKDRIIKSIDIEKIII
jgi:hypothetical protein